MKLVFVAALAAAAVAAAPAAAEISERIVLAPKGGSGVSGTALVASPGDRAAARVTVELRGLKPGAVVRVMLNAVEGKNVGASTVLILKARATGKGTLTATGRVRYRGAPVTFSSIADGAHAVTAVAGGKAVARGVIPGMS